MGAFLRGVIRLRPAGLTDDGAEGGDEFFMNAPEFDGGAGDLGAVSALPAPVHVFFAWEFRVERMNGGGARQRPWLRTDQPMA